MNLYELNNLIASIEVKDGWDEQLAFYKEMRKKLVAKLNKDIASMI